MNVIQICLSTVYCVVVVLTMIGYAKQKFWLRAINKSLLMPVLAALYASFAQRPNLWILLALFGGWLGDVFLLGKKIWNRNGGLLFFAFGHIFYLIAMLSCGLVLHPVLALCSGWLLLMVWLLWKYAISFGPRYYRYSGLCYAILLSGVSAAACYLMCISWFTWEYCLCFIGTISFVASDCVLARSVFGLHSDSRGVFVMASYIFAQTALAIGFALHGGI